MSREVGKNKQTPQFNIVNVSKCHTYSPLNSIASLAGITYPNGIRHFLVKENVRWTVSKDLGLRLQFCPKRDGITLI